MDSVDTILSIGSTISSVLGLVFYRYYRNRTDTARQVKQLRVWHPDVDLLNHLNAADNQSLDYAAVEGVVKEMGRNLRSHYIPAEGVIKRSQIIEHKSKRVNGFWSEMKKIIKDSTEMVPFAIMKSEQGDPKYRVEVLDPASAGQIQDELSSTHDHFEPSKSTFMQIGLDRLFGEVSKGIQETESMLLTGTTVLGVGKVFLERGQLKITAPEESNRSYIVTTMRLPELVRHIESQSSTYKILSIIFTIVGGSMLAYIIWKHVKKYLEDRKSKLEFEAIRRNLAEARRVQSKPSRSTSQQESEEEEGQSGLREEDTCVVCLTNPRQVIVLNCGHIAMCVDCAELLPVPKKCPVCRADVERVMPVYRP